MIGHLVATNADGIERFYSPRAGRSIGAAAGWTEKPAEALAFARERDAQTFLEFHLPHMQGAARVVTQELAA